MRFRFHGLRKLNWVERPPGDYGEHLVRTGFDRWLEPGPFAIVVGPNAGGKSTVVDLMRGLGDPSLWPGLARENYPNEDFSGFDVEGAGFALGVRFSKYTPDPQDTYDQLTILAVASGPGGAGTATVFAPKHGREGDWVEPLRGLLDLCALPRPAYMEPFGGHPGDGLSDEELASALNALGRHFPSVLAGAGVDPFKTYVGSTPGAGRIGVLFKDEPGQRSYVHRRALSLGWLQLADVWSFLRGCEPGALVVLDEPDRHLHPSLQRVMLDIVAEERVRLGATVVLATHSSVLINPELCGRVGAVTFVAARGRCEPLTDARQVLDDLGVTSGDLVQANGVVWVEGPSDRLYVKAWLDRWAESLGKPPWIERVHYAFVSYGGALMKYLALSGEHGDKVDLRSINRNYALVMDRDLDDAGAGGLRGEKGRLLAEAAALGTDDHVWVTEGYAIEGYLPVDWPPAALHVRTTTKGRIVVEGIAKAELARRFASDGRGWRESHRDGSDVPRRIAGLFELIAAWQTPQEVIEPAYLPPFLHDPDP